MERNQVRKMTYFKPEIKSFYVEPVNHLLETSYPGDHNPGIHKPGPSEEEEAKRIVFEEETGGEFWED